MGSSMVRVRLTVCALTLLAGIGSSALAEEWSSPRWCGPHLIPRLMEQYEPKEADAYSRYVFLGDALQAMG